MILKVFSVYDAKLGAFLQPIFQQATGVAMRMFEAAVMDANHDFHNFAGDYCLFELGEFDQESGEFTTLRTPLQLVSALQVLDAQTREASAEPQAKSLAGVA